MANIEYVMQRKMAKINRIISDGLKNIVGEEIRLTLVYYIENNFYSIGYIRSGMLAKSLKVNVEMNKDNSFTVEVYFDDKKIKHSTIYGSEKLGINSGDIVYTVQWINDGWTYLHGSREKRLKDLGIEPQFIEDALDDLKRNKGWLDKFYTYLRNNGINIQNL